MISVNFCSNKITEFEAQLKDQKSPSEIDGIIAEKIKLKHELSGVKENLNNLDQISRMNNLEIVRVPERENENLVEIFKSITEGLNHKLGTSYIDYIHRISLNSNGTSQLKNIVVRFHSRRKTNGLLSVVKQLRRTNKTPYNYFWVKMVTFTLERMTTLEYCSSNSVMLFPS